MLRASYRLEHRTQIRSRSRRVRRASTLRGIVHGADGNPLHDVVVNVVGTDRSARSDATGAFRIDQIPAGTRTMEAKSIGMLPVTFSMDFPTHGTHDTTFAISQRTQDEGRRDRGAQHDAVIDGEQWISGWRSHGLGYFIVEADIKKHIPESR